MSVLLDTCAVLALAQGVLPDSAARALRVAPEAIVSAVTPWEVAIKVAQGKLSLTQPPASWFFELCDRYELREIPVDSRTACAAAALPLIHRDPFDRVLIALAQALTLTVLTSDEHIPRYPGVTALWL